MSDDSTDGSHSTRPRAAKKRKPTYLVRKEEEKALRGEILRLQSQVAVLKTRGLPASEVIAADPVLQESTAKRKTLTGAIRDQQLGLAAAQSLMMECSVRPRGKDWADRRAALLAIRDEKLKNAYDFVKARSHFIADGFGHESSEKFETKDGDVCFVGNVVLQFPGVQSLKKVYEALYFYLTNMEISISERLGHITVREDYDVLEGSLYNARITSRDNNGVATESNTIVFTQLFEHGDAEFGGEPCAIVAADCVDEDELHPYRPGERVRKDISGAIVLTTTKRSKQLKVKAAASIAENVDDNTVDVTMRRTGYLRLHRPEFPVSSLAQQELEAGIADWGGVMFKAMREILYARK
ncbi:unnamed protein product [Phytophthora fragariaefolia]|uniref:Unnamed protein product n=1 Tax=Phytophthora fragariaefolia TaxID=1490495 RepID=A0A9W7CRM2_9STRA|nr:unnamed protein product [Phytophthora fragariaefolia]